MSVKYLNESYKFHSDRFGSQVNKTENNGGSVKVVNWNQLEKRNWIDIIWCVDEEALD